MKTLGKFLLIAAMLGSLPFAWTGCIGVVGEEGVVYGDGPWFHDSIWLDGGGRGWYGGNRGAGYVHPGGGGHGGRSGTRGRH